MQNKEERVQELTGDAGASDKLAYAAPDIDTAPGELMQTIRGTGGACDVQSDASDDGCSSN